jgi:hypothetical protein
MAEDAVNPKEHDEAVDNFAKLKKQAKKKGEKAGKKDRASWSDELKEAKAAQLRVRTAALPKGQRIDKGIDVYVVRKLPAAGGIFGCATGAVIYAQDRGKGLNIAKVLAHELGHALSLPHTPCADDAKPDDGRRVQT